MKIKTGDHVTIDNLIHGATVVAFSRDKKKVKVRYHCPRKGRVIRSVSINQITRG